MTTTASDDLPVLVDDREKLPFEFNDVAATTETVRMETGDYTVPGFEDVFAVERKSIADLVQSVTWGRDRFEDEIKRAQSLAEWAIIIEGVPSDVTSHIAARRRYGAKVHPNSILGTVRSWNQYKNANFIWAGSREEAEMLTYQKLQEWSAEYRHLYE